MKFTGLLQYFKQYNYNKQDLGRYLSILGLTFIFLLTVKQGLSVVLTDYTVSDQEHGKLATVKPVIQHGYLFGEYLGNKPLQETGLNMELKAVFATQDPQKGSAVISVSGRKPALQVVGDVLPGGVTLKEVHPDYVVLEQGGQRSILRLPKRVL